MFMLVWVLGWEGWYAFVWGKGKLQSFMFGKNVMRMEKYQ